MPYTQFCQTTLDYSVDTVESSLPSSGNNLSIIKTETPQLVDDILSRMDKLRILASMQKKRSRSSKRQQYSFCF